MRLLGHGDADVLEHAAGCLAAVARGSDARRDAAKDAGAVAPLLRIQAAGGAPDAAAQAAAGRALAELAPLTGRSGGAKPI